MPNSSSSSSTKKPAATTKVETTPAPAPDPVLITGLPGFVQPRTMPTTDPAPENATVTTPTSSSSSGRDALDGANDGEDEDELVSPKLPSSSPASIARADAASFEPILGVAFGFAGVMAHNRLAPGDNPVWIPDEEDTDAVCKPLSRIIARHTPITGDAGGDLVDGLEATIGAGGYVLKNLNMQREYAFQLQQQAQEQEQRA